jgi:predicted helicase
MFCISNKSREGQTLFPLFVPDESDLFRSANKKSVRPNLGTRFKTQLARLLSDDTMTSEVATDAFNYIYAILHSQVYRNRLRRSF